MLLSRLKLLNSSISFPVLNLISVICDTHVLLFICLFIDVFIHLFMQHFLPGYLFLPELLFAFLFP